MSASGQNTPSSARAAKVSLAPESGSRGDETDWVLTLGAKAAHFLAGQQSRAVSTQAAADLAIAPRADKVRCGVISVRVAEGNERPLRAG